VFVKLSDSYLLAFYTSCETVLSVMLYVSLLGFLPDVDSVECYFVRSELPVKLVVLLFAGDSVLCRDWSVSEDHSLCQEGRLHARLRVPTAQHHADQPGAGRAVCTDAGSR